jgi:lipopolysaccharide transport system ATP-binding protein
MSAVRIINGSSMDELAVSAQGLSKTYRVYATPLDRAREALTRRPRHREFHALRDVGFQVPRGQGFGLMGENGAGKSTLLKILSGVSMPSAGTFQIGGKVASILELGSGFHPQFTGRQNVVLNAAMLGLSEREVRERLPAIVEWSELGEFIDQPVKTYSSGMVMRLGFSIATQVDPEVLIIDEALSVGDGYFQKKCVDRLLAMVRDGKTLLFCSHAMYYVSAFCERALWLRHGRVEALGATAEVVREYETFLIKKTGEPHALPQGPVGSGRRMARLVAVEQPGKAGSPPVYRSGEPFCVEIEWESFDRHADFQVGVGINRSDGLEVASFATHFSGNEPLCGETRYAVRLELPELPLLKGEFALYVFLLDGAGLHIYDQRILPHALAVENPSYRFGLVTMPHRFTVLQPAASEPLVVVK